MDRRRQLGAGRPHGERRAPRVDLDDVVYGVHAVDEMLAAGEALRHIHVGDDRKRDPALKNLLERARTANVPVRFESRTFFATFPYKAHQGVVAFGEPFAYLSSTRRWRGGGATGRRSSCCSTTSPTRTTSARSSARPSAPAPVPSCCPTGAAPASTRPCASPRPGRPRSCRWRGWPTWPRRCGRSRRPESGSTARPLGEGARPYTEVDLAGDIALVIGAEGEGIAPLVERECDGLLEIPLLGRVASLNASVAAGILLYEAVRQRPKPSA